jgi:hypothetical protein
MNLLHKPPSRKTKVCEAKIPVWCIFRAHLSRESEITWARIPAQCGRKFLTPGQARTGHLKRSDARNKRGDSEGGKRAPSRNGTFRWDDSSGVIGASDYTFVEATRTQTMQDFCTPTVCMF